MLVSVDGCSSPSTVLNVSISAPPALRPLSTALDSKPSTRHPRTRLHHLHKQLFGLLPPPLIPKRRRQVGHAGQRGRMLFPKHPRTRLHHFHLQHFGLIQPPLIPLR